MSYIIQQCYELLKKLFNILGGLGWHVIREGNQIADSFAVMAFARPLDMYIYMQPPNEIFQKLHENYYWMTWPHLVYGFILLNVKKKKKKIIFASTSLGIDFCFTYRTLQKLKKP